MNEPRSLAAVEMFADLGEDDLVRIARRCRWRLVRAGETALADEADDANEADGADEAAVGFLILGRLRQVNVSFSGREVTLDDLGPGRPFGEVAALGGGARPGRVVAVSDSVVAVMSAGDFRAVLAEFPAVRARAMAHLAGLVAAADARVTDLASMTAIDRVYAELLRLAVPADGDGDGGPLVITPIPMLSEVARRIGAARETVSRVIGELTQSGVVERGDDALVIVDVERLRASIGRDGPADRRTGRDRRLGVDRRRAAGPPPTVERRRGDRRQGA